MKVPISVGMPIILSTLADQMAVNPSGKPVAAPIPVAPVVLNDVFPSTVLTHTELIDEADAMVLTGLTVMVPVAFKRSHPPNKGIV